MSFPGNDAQASPIPPCVAAAQQFLHFAESLRNPPGGFDGMRTEGRDLESKEQAVYDAALEVLREYFAHEVTYSSTAAPVPPDDSDPRERAAVQV